MSVALRPMAAGDRDQVLAWRNSPEVAGYMYTEGTISAEAHARWFAATLASPDRRYWIIEADGTGVGVAALTWIEPENRRCEWAYYLGDPATRGRGIGTAVEYIVIEEVFGPMGLNKIACEVLVENEAVWRLHESFGFMREAFYRDHVLKAGVFRDVMGLSLLARDWPAARPAALERLRAKGYDPAGLRIVAS
jgi:UDP-4-amino-4,6-dideoxy-N-acetyl-beta-L-altrosamine N-acetyltransferase